MTITASSLMPPRRSHNFSSKRIVQCRPSAPSARFGRRRRFCTTKPIARKTVRKPLRYSRHYYDLAMMAAAPVKDAALADLALLEDVVAFKQRFYRRPWAHYELARPGTFRLVPAEHVLAAVEKDYVQMRNMIFGRYPGFAEIMETLRALEAEINGLHRG